MNYPFCKHYPAYHRHSSLKAFVAKYKTICDLDTILTKIENFAITSYLSAYIISACLWQHVVAICTKI
jgi:hypothetical protein